MKNSKFKIGDKIRICNNNYTSYGVYADDIGEIKCVDKRNSRTGSDYYAVEFENISMGNSCGGFCRSYKGLWVRLEDIKSAGVYWTIEVTSVTNGRIKKEDEKSRAPFVLRQM